MNLAKYHDLAFGILSKAKDTKTLLTGINYSTCLRSLNHQW